MYSCKSFWNLFWPHEGSQIVILRFRQKILLEKALPFYGATLFELKLQNT
jgi:hypothetical protein